MNCPKCNTHKISRSHSRGLERISRLLGRKYFRCEKCGYRFSRFKIKATISWLYVAIVALCLLGAIMVFRAFITYSENSESTEIQP